MLAEKYNSKVFFFFSYSDQNIVQFDVKLKKSVHLTKFVVFILSLGVEEREGAIVLLAAACLCIAMGPLWHPNRKKRKTKMTNLLVLND